jgi:hypothetical protein
MTQLLSPLTSTPYPSTSSNAITDLLEVPDAVLWIEKYVTIRFASTAARDAAIAVPEDGMMVYITGTPKQVFVYNGAAIAWELIWQSTPTSWTPTIASGITTGNGVWSAGSYTVKEHWCYAWFAFTFGSTSSFTTPVLVFPPILIKAAYPVLASVGSCEVYDTSAGTAGRFTAGLFVTSTSASTYGTFAMSTNGAQVTSTSPMTWATGDVLSGVLQYETV